MGSIPALNLDVRGSPHLSNDQAEVNSHCFPHSRDFQFGTEWKEKKEHNSLRDCWVIWTARMYTEVAAQCLTLMEASGLQRKMKTNPLQKKSPVPRFQGILFMDNVNTHNRKLRKHRAKEHTEILGKASWDNRKKRQSHETSDIEGSRFK